MILQEVEKTKCKARPSSIVDRMIKSSLSPAPGCQVRREPCREKD